MRFATLFVIALCCGVDTAQPEAPRGNDAESIQDAVRRQIATVKACYTNEQASGRPADGGRMEVQVIIDGGAVTSVVVVSNTAGGAELSACVVDAIRAWEFPQSINAEFLYPIAFSP